MAQEYTKFYGTEYDPATIFRNTPSGMYGFCFGYLNGELYVGARHHMAIMQALIAQGWTWDDLMNADQIWGWVYPGNDYDADGKMFHYIAVRFSSDQAFLNRELEDEAKDAIGDFLGGVVLKVSPGYDPSTEGQYAPGYKNKYGPGGTIEHWNPIEIKRFKKRSKGKPQNNAGSSGNTINIRYSALSNGALARWLWTPQTGIVVWPEEKFHMNKADELELDYGQIASGYLLPEGRWHAYFDKQFLENEERITHDMGLIGYDELDEEWDPWQSSSILRQRDEEWDDINRAVLELESKIAYQVNGKPWRPCFGYVDGKLYLGERHHMAIMQALINEFGYSFDSLMNAEQTWGWLYMIDEEYDAVKGGWKRIDPPRHVVKFSTDAGVTKNTELNREAKEVIEDYFGISFEWSGGEGTSYQTNQEYAPNYKAYYEDEGPYVDRPIKVDVVESKPDENEQLKLGAEEKYKLSSCFGYVDGKLYLGTRHHMAIMKALIDEFGYDFESLMNARQTWGWLRKDYPERYDEETGGYIWDEPEFGISFTTDAGYTKDEEINEEAKAVIEKYYGVPFVQEGNPYQPNNYAPVFDSTYGPGGYLEKKPIDVTVVDPQKLSAKKRKKRKKNYRSKTRKIRYHVRPRRKRNGTLFLSGHGWESPELAKQWKQINDAFEPHDVWTAEGDGTALGVVDGGV